MKYHSHTTRKIKHRQDPKGFLLCKNNGTAERFFLILQHYPSREYYPQKKYILFWFLHIISKTENFKFEHVYGQDI